MNTRLCHKTVTYSCLNQLKKGSWIILTGFTETCPFEFKKWFLKHGFVRGARISIHAISPFNDPVAYQIYDSTIVLRNEDAKYLQGIINKDDV